MTWVEKGVAGVRNELGSSPDLVRLPVAAALGIIEDNSQVLATGTSAGFALAVAHLAAHDEKSARLAWLASGATHAERMEALALAHEDVDSDAAQKLAAWEEAKRIAIQVISAAGKVGLPLLLAAL